MSPIEMHSFLARYVPNVLWRQEIIRRILNEKTVSWFQGFAVGAILAAFIAWVSVAP